MSAEPALPGPDGDGRAATVFAFRRPVRRQEAAMPLPPAGDLTPQDRLAATIEKAFADHRRTLTDPDTAEAFLISLGLMRRTLDGALAQGLIDQPAHADLAGMLDGMREATRLLA
ncbi:hypothetical protein [Streptomyces sp. DHE17-7]|uniref:hypothetical protein n=1 Tax=Streptomyces sp. DHE17-7 TaxID=2759949 RepID=UPI000EECD333|nr:hypothetical protein [Streptomyces sp. DHE17-7]RIH58229.1 hypothetical protein D3C59_36505 [Streptomyces sp. SHP22-7]MBJ6623552.1 hypothetical protein [Streptomyces sp. DHE17-7]RIH58264.1 hypothetical protein D3C59_36225 [Streptomyces sp. SHP22-7]RIH58529.1 hypothetical protein D3C59_34530 [Streptomyces sp. SHP22-7]RIH58624.1 hypothetical protein D3C59_33815 [Streptomyces sp. SHP22-7]